MNKFLLFIAMLIASFVNAQTQQRVCGSMDNLDRLKQEDPSLAARMQQIESQTAAYIVQHASQNSMNSIITIPVVFHVVYNTTAQNISDAQCIAQLNQLNLDYSRLNTDRTNTPTVWQSISVNTNIQFCLAQRTASGAATTGIERKQTSTTSFSTNDNVKHVSSGGMDAWPMTSYLNIWVCNLSGGVLGYAQFPGGSASTDGVVLHYTSVGSMLSPGPTSGSPYNKGRTATHEVGHWLNLYHIWGDESQCSGTDNVGDTPNQGPENYGCPTYPHTDNCQTASPGVMFMNYMDYVDDGCMNMFTAGQSTRMNALFTTGGARVAIASSMGCSPPSTSSCGVPTGLSSTSITTSGATLNWTAVSGATSYNIQYKVSTASSWNTTTSTTTSKSLTGLLSGTTYSWQVQSVCSGGTSTYTSAATFTTTAATGCGTPSSLTTTALAANSVTLNWTAVSGATSYNIQYKTAAATTWNTTTSSTNSKSLTGLLAATSYQWKVQSVCSSGTGTYTATASFTTSSSTSCGTPVNLVSNAITSSGATIGWTAVSGATSYNVQYKISSASTWTTVNTTATTYPLSGLAASTVYQWQVRTVCSGGTGSWSATASFTTAAAGCTDNYESNNSYTTATTISTNTTVSALIGSTTDSDWFRFTTTSPYTKIKITLTNLAADYDIRLYSSGLSYLAISQNSGTAGETIIYNATVGATYYVRVYGYSGAYSTTQCYNLRVNTSSINFKLSEEAEQTVTSEAINELKLYPNPVRDNVSIAFNSSIDQSATLRVFDLMGKTVFIVPVELNMGENKFNYDLSNVPQGIYFAELQNATDRIVTKFIVEK